MISSSTPSLYNTGRIGVDSAEIAQRDILNTKHQDYYTANYFSDPSSGRHIDFAAAFPTMTYSGSRVGGSDIDHSSQLSFLGVS